MFRRADPISDRSDVPAPRAWMFIGRALRLRCPECGISPIFLPLRRVRSIDDWLRPLDGCPRCGFAYEREQGYWLLAIWGVNYGIVGGIGLIVGLTIQHFWNPPIAVILAALFLPLPILSLLIARHAKALYLAMDHYFDPHIKGS
jgi:uncharacterized protein (DUF983 family)